jgi:hypothetical protein
VELWIKTPTGVEYQTNSCEKQINVYHVPTITDITSVQGSPNQYMIDTEIFGYYLQNWESQWLCFFYMFEEHLKAPVKIRFSELPSTFLTSDMRRVQCRFTDALYFLTTFRRFEVKGITNLQDFFYNKTLTWKNSPVNSMFIFSHLVATVDPLTFTSEPNIAHNSI